MGLKINIETDNAAFEDNAGIECARILRKVAQKIEDWSGANDFSLGLLDINGNRVGEAIGEAQEEEREVREFTSDDEDAPREVRAWNEGESDAERNR
jgi:hypothetical protein